MGGRYLVLFLCLIQSGWSAPMEPIAISLNTRRPNHVLDEHFVSLSLNPTDLLQGRPFGMASNSTIAILKGLAPAFVRLGGADTNKYLFKTKNNDIDRTSDEIIISEEHWKGLNDFLRKSGMDVIVCLNSAHRGGDKWDPRNALELISFSDRQQYNITWQLGYEPIRVENISGTQFGKDISQLRSILNAFPRYRDAKIIGPDIRALHKKEDVEHVLDILIESGPAVNAVTWHPRWPHASAITPSDASEDGYDFPPDYLEWDRNQLHKLLQRTLLKKPFWISEPKAENTGSFAEGLIYARRLALAAKLGIEVVMKQPSMQDISHPKPEYWLALLHKKTMGRTVLDTRAMANHSEVHLVIQCANKMYAEHQDGGITVFAVNTAGSGQRAIIRGLPLGHVNEAVHQYTLTGGNEHEKIFSQMTFLNGEPLLMTDGGQLPDLTPKSKRLGQTLQVKIPPYSIGFWVIPRAKVKLCEQEPESLNSFILDQVTSPVLETAQQGINNLNNINNLMVETLLNPIVSAEEAENQVEPEESQHKRPHRDISIDSLSTDLRKNVEEIKQLMQAHRNALKRSLPQSESSENQLRAAERKIDGLVDDLSNAIQGVDQKTEFALFLEKAGLKPDFGQWMKNEDRKKRDINPNDLKHKLFFKESDLDLADIEKRFRRILAKHKRAMDSKRPSLELGKLSREMHEDLLLKEITLLEKTEETLAEVMKSRQERFEQMEEMIHNELEQIKDEKLAALVEIKSNNGAEATTSIPKTKRDANPKTDPLTAIKNFISKRREELSQRRSLHEKFLEARNKPKENATTETITTTTTTTTEETSAPTSKPVVLNNDEKRRSDVLKYMEESISKARPGLETSQSLEDDMFSKRKPRKIDHDDSGRRTVNLPSVLMEKILETLKEGKSVDQKTFPATGESNGASTTEPTTTSQDLEHKSTELATELPDIERESKATTTELPDFERKSKTTTTEFPDFKRKSEATTTESTNLEPEPLQLEPKSANLEPEQLQLKPKSANLEPKPLQLESKSAKLEPEPLQLEPKSTNLEPEPVQLESKSPKMESKSPDQETKPTDPEPATLKEAIPTTTGSVQFLPNEGFQSTDASSGEKQARESVEATTLAAAQPQSTTEPTKEERTRRDTAAASISTQTPANLDKGLPSDSEKRLGNSLLKKKSSADALNKDEEEVLNLAESTVKTVFNDFIPKAYDTAKEQIQSLGLADYLKNLGSMIEKLQHVDEILKDAAVLTNSSSGHHVQKIKRSRREAEEVTTQQPITTQEPTTELPSFNEIAELMAADDEIEKALDKLAEKLVTQELENHIQPTSVSSEEDPITPRLGKEQDIMKEIINKLMKKGEPKRSPRHSFPTPDADEPVSEFLKKLRPGVYVVPSKDMANVHAEQTARSAVARKDGKPAANVLTLNIYYDKADKQDDTQMPRQEVFGHQWPGQQMYQTPEEPIRQYPTRYSAYPPHQYYGSRIQPKYANQQPYDDYLYETPNVQKPTSPKLIPLTSWTKAEPSAPTWELANLPFEKPSSYEVLPNKLKPPVTAKDEDPLDPVQEEVSVDRRRSIEPYWNKTIKDIFEETADDPFWKFLQVPQAVTKEAQTSAQPENRRKRSLYYSSSTTPSSDTPDFLNNNQIDYRRNRRSMMDNYIIKQKQPERYPLDNNRVMHGIFAKQFKKLTDLDSSLEPGDGINSANFIQPKAAEFMYPMPKPAVATVVDESGEDQSITFPLKQVYDMAVDFVKRLSSAV